MLTVTCLKLYVWSDLAASPDHDDLRPVAGQGGVLVPLCLRQLGNSLPLLHKYLKKCMILNMNSSLFFTIDICTWLYVLGTKIRVC
jgi:hypothetical protein